MSKPSSAPSYEQQQQQQQQQKLQQELQDHVQSYPIQLKYPPSLFLASPESSSTQGSTTSSSSSSNDNVNADNNTQQSTYHDKNGKSPRTLPEFINHRFIESGAEAATTLNDVTESLAKFVHDVESTGCFNSIQVILGREEVNDNGKSTTTTTTNENSYAPQRQVDIVLNEKNWYKIFIGGGFKHDGIVGQVGAGGNALSNSMGLAFPKVQFESSLSLINLTGHCEKTELSYALDQTSSPSLTFMHNRPLYSMLTDYSSIRNFILSGNEGSKIGISFRGQIDTLDHEYTRSSKDHVQLIGLRIANTTNGSATGGGNGGVLESVYRGIDWTMSFRDIIPRRSLSIPYLCDSSPDIVAASGPSLKHSLSAEYNLNGNYTDDRFNPTVGLDSHGGIEIAGPPGDVGFVKCWGGAALHIPLVEPMNSNGKNTFLQHLIGGLSFHTAINGGVIKPLSYGGLCCNSHGVTNVIDRFYVGGSHQLRGFLPSGIGPRAQSGGSSTPGGDSLGGDAFYTASASLSVPFPGLSFFSKNGVRLFGFANAGTLLGLENATQLDAFIRSTRVAVGGGVSVGTRIGRLEATYAIPLRYGPKDARRSVQAGIGFSFG